MFAKSELLQSHNFTFAKNAPFEKMAHLKNIPLEFEELIIDPPIFKILLE